MSEAEFLEKLREIIQRDDAISADLYLWDMDEWDSLAIMACMAWFERDFGRVLKFSELKDLDSPAQLFALADGSK